MKAAILVLLAITFACTSTLGAVQGSWQPGRIVEVQKSVNPQTLYWIVNTPVTRDETNYKITVHLGQKLMTGVYTVDKLHSAAPDEWVRGKPVKVRIDGNDMYLKPLSGDDIKLRIVKRKAAPAMQPVTDAEMKEAYTPAPQVESLESNTKDATPEPPPLAEQSKEESPTVASQTPRAASGPIGVIDITTVPYLAEIYIDGASLGYSPAKLTLSAGKHALRIQKDGYQAWSKDITVLENSEFTVSAELKRK